MQDLTNAHLASIGAYNDLVPAFDALLAQVSGDFPRFYEEVKRLARCRRSAAKTRCAACWRSVSRVYDGGCAIKMKI